MKRTRIIIGIALALCFAALVVISRITSSDNVVISDLLLYEHENSDFYIDVLFDDADFNGTSSDKTVIIIVNSRTFNTKDEPDPIYRSTIKKLEIEYNSLPLREVTDECEIVRNVEASGASVLEYYPHNLYIIDNKYLLYQYTNEQGLYSNAKRWQTMYEADKKTQTEIIEHADYKTVGRYKFGPRYHATPEGQIQCIYKYKNEDEYPTV